MPKAKKICNRYTPLNTTIKALLSAFSLKLASLKRVSDYSRIKKW